MKAYRWKTRIKGGVWGYSPQQATRTRRSWVRMACLILTRRGPRDSRVTQGPHKQGPPYLSLTKTQRATRTTRDTANTPVTPANTSPVKPGLISAPNPCPCLLALLSLLLPSPHHHHYSLKLTIFNSLLYVCL